VVLEVGIGRAVVWKRGAALVQWWVGGATYWDRGGCVRGLRWVLGGERARAVGEMSHPSLMANPNAQTHVRQDQVSHMR
jgi:hypothetical protein